MPTKLIVDAADTVMDEGIEKASNTLGNKSAQINDDGSILNTFNNQQHLFVNPFVLLAFSI